LLSDLRGAHIRREIMDNEFSGSPKTWPPLGLPTGSVRALLTLIVVGVVVTKMVFHRPPDSIWIETLLIALAHYFTSRRFVSLSPEIMRRLEEDGALEKERHPLYLPKNTIRFLIIGAFVGLGVHLHREERLFEPQTISLLSMVFAYLLGAVIGGLANWISRQRRQPASGTWGDIKALVVLSGMLVIAVVELLDAGPMLHPAVERVSLGLTLFYFGSR
jgi:hypothetical protein